MSQKTSLPIRRNIEARYAWLSGLMDTLAVLVAFYVGMHRHSNPSGPEFTVFLAICLIIVPVSFNALGVYDNPARHTSRVAELGILISAWIPTAIILAGILRISRLPHLGPKTYAAIFTSIPFVLFIFRRVTQALFLNVQRRRAHSAIIVGATEIGLRLADELQKSHHYGFRFLGFFEYRKTERLALTTEHRILGSTREVLDFVRTHVIEFVFITLPMRAEPRIVRLTEELGDTTTSVCFVPDLFSFDLLQAGIWHLDGIPVVTLRDTPFRGFDAILKGAIDYLVAALVCILTAPFLLIFAIGVKLSSPGPIFYVQRRYGLNGKAINVYKFRTMYATEEDHPELKQAKKGDPRVTPFGAFLRRTSMDELPQFINVLQGRMSIVGPRPHVASQNELYRKLIKGYMLRYKVKPGITGWAQVNGLRGETELIEKMEARVRYDEYYLRNWSVGFDLLIIIKTIIVVIRDTNAY